MSELTPTAVERAAFECQSFAQAAAHLGVEKLVVILQNHPDLHAAWKRGRRLRKVQDLATTTISVTQAAKELGMTGMDFRALLDSDEEVRDVWDQQRRRLRMDMAGAMVIQAKEGKPNAVRYVENFLRSEQSPVGFDHQHVPISIMVEITDKTRQTLYAWTRDQGCPRNADATYNLTEFFQWYSSWQQSKVLPSHMVFQIRKAVRETLRESMGPSPQPSAPTSEPVTPSNGGSLTPGRPGPGEHGVAGKNPKTGPGARPGQNTGTGKGDAPDRAGKVMSV